MHACNNSFFSMQIAKNPAVFASGKKIKIRISGDGAKFSRTSNFILLSYAILEPSIGQYLSGLGKKVNRPTHAVMFTIDNTVGACRQPYYCSSSQRYGRLLNNLRSVFCDL